MASVVPTFLHQRHLYLITFSWLLMWLSRVFWLWRMTSQSVQPKGADLFFFISSFQSLLEMPWSITWSFGKACVWYLLWWVTRADLVGAKYGLPSACSWLSLQLNFAPGSWASRWLPYSKAESHVSSQTLHRNPFCSFLDLIFLLISQIIYNSNKQTQSSFTLLAKSI